MRKLAVVGLLLALAPSTPQAQQSKATDGVVWAASWEDAIAEATARNVPIHIALHKDH